MLGYVDHISGHYLKYAAIVDQIFITISIINQN